MSKSKLKPIPVTEGKYKVTIKFADKLFESKTDSIQEYMKNVVPETITNRVVMRFEIEGKIVDKLLSVAQARRTFYNPLATQIYARNIERSLV
jgi:hypothetical protein